MLIYTAPKSYYIILFAQKIENTMGYLTGDVRKEENATPE